MNVFDRYMMKNMLVATLFVAVVLSVIILLTQSLRFLELVIESGASALVFWQLTLLALPRFFEVILPIALMVGVVFIYVRMIADSEMVVLRAAGLSAINLARPAILLAVFFTVVLLSITMWVSPTSMAKMQTMRQIVKSQFSMLFFKEGIFNQIGSGVTVYIRDKDSNGELRGIMIQDSRDSSQNPSTVIARRGVLVANDDGFQVLVYEGSRQEYDPIKQVLKRLNFERYTIDLPNSGEIGERWAEPGERTIFALLSPDLNDASDVANLREFKLEIHKRFISPFLALSFTLIACTCLLIGPYDRRGQVKRIVLAVLSVALLQGVYLSVFNVAKHNDIGLLLMYFLVIVPCLVCLFLLTRFSERFRRYVLYGGRS